MLRGAFEGWHFLNVPRTTHNVLDLHCGGNCVLTGIAHHADALTNASTDLRSDSGCRPIADCRSSRLTIFALASISRAKSRR